jgi:hypothetical protein
MQEKIALFTALTSTAIAAAAENWSEENADQWTEPDNCLVCLWPSKSRFYSWLQSKVAASLPRMVLDYRRFLLL